MNTSPADSSESADISSTTADTPKESVLARERRQQIASLTAIHGRVTVVELSRHFDVTPETIRRDLTALDEEGALHRIHGGAVPIQGYQTAVQTMESRLNSAPNAKKSIGEKALEFLPEASGSAFLDAGTTTAMLAHAMSSANPATPWKVTTNFLPLASELAGSGNADVTIIGGTVRDVTQAVVGEQALRSVGIMKTDVAFIGTNALTMGYGLSTADSDEAALKRALIAHADTVIAMCDSTKFGRDYMVNFANISDIDVLITDKAAPQSYIDALEEQGVQVVLA